MQKKIENYEFLLTNVAFQWLGIFSGMLLSSCTNHDKNPAIRAPKVSEDIFWIAKSHETSTHSLFLGSFYWWSLMHNEMSPTTEGILEIILGSVMKKFEKIVGNPVAIIPG